MLKERMNVASLINEVVSDRSISNIKIYLVDSLAEHLADDATCIIEINDEDFFEKLERVDFHYERGSVGCVSIYMNRE
jgi:hypothetical protein